MPRPKKYENDAERHRAYRTRRAETLDTLKHLRGQALGQIPLEPGEDRRTVHRLKSANERRAAKEIGQQMRGEVQPPTPIALSAEWFRVTIQTNTGAKMEYIMEEGEMGRLQSDLRSFKIGASDAPTHGTYIYANQGPDLIKFPGLFVLTFEGASIPATERVEGFTPSNTYSIYSGMMELLLSQKPRPRKSDKST